MICKKCNIRFYHARIAPMGAERKIFTGELHVEGNRITYVGDAENAPQKSTWDREIDVENDLLLPGFKNAHTHTAMTFLRSYADDVPLQTWLYEKIFPMEDKLTVEDQYWLIRLGIMEYLTSGITANFDMYRDFDCHAEVSRDVGFRTVMCSGLNDFCSYGYGGPNPPHGHGWHNYMITLYALDIESLEMSKDTLPAQVGFKLWKHTLEKASIVFYYRT